MYLNKIPLLYKCKQFASLFVVVNKCLQIYKLRL